METLVESQELLASNGQAVQLLDLAKNKLNQFYSPSQFVDTTTKNPFDPYAFLQSSSRKVEAPPATFEGGYQAKMSESHGIFSLIAQLKAGGEGKGGPLFLSQRLRGPQSRTFARSCFFLPC